MAWIESHTVLLRHRKVIELAKDLGLKPVQVLGHLHALWHAALEQQEDGDLSSWSDEVLAETAAFEGDPKVFVSALQRREWLDGRLLHGWLDYAGKYLTAKYRTSNPKRLREIYRSHKSVFSRAKIGNSSTQDAIGLGKVILGSEKGREEGAGEERVSVGGKEFSWPSPEALVALYNAEAADDLPAVTILSDGRRKKCREYLGKFPKLDFWREVFKETKLSRFLRGLESSNGHRGFKGDLDWLLTRGKDQSENCVKVAEGKYRDQRG